MELPYTIIGYGRYKGRVLSNTDGGLYVITRTKFNAKEVKVKYLKCNVRACKHRGKIVDDIFTTSEKANHNHEIDHLTGRTWKVFMLLKEEVRTSTRLVRELHTEMIRREPIEITSELPWKKVRMTLRRTRRSILPSCTELSKMIDLLESNDQVKELYGSYRGRPLYRGAITVGKSTSIVFAVEQHLKQLKPGFNMYCDGTFSIIPLKFKQLYIIMGEIEEKPRLIAYILMEGRSYEDYLYLFKFLRDALSIEPGSIMADFEKAVRKAAKEVWPACKIEGCMFHFCQALRRMARSMEEITKLLEKTQPIRIKSQAHTILKMYMMLCLVPLPRVDEGIESIKKYTKQQRLTKPFTRFHKYFLDTWVHRYKPSEWNVSSRVRRTNNDLESLNGVLKTALQRSPDVYRFMDSMLSIVHRAHNNYIYETKYITNRTPTSKFTEPLRMALEHLEVGVINVIVFLQQMARV